MVAILCWVLFAKGIIGLTLPIISSIEVLLEFAVLTARFCGLGTKLENS